MTTHEPDRIWQSLAEYPALDGDEVHVWRCGADLPEPRVEALRQTLSVEERARAARFASPQDRDRFIARRGLLRVILGRYLGADPSHLQFEYGVYGKPALAGSPIRFNVSHSAGLVLYAVARRCEIGVDLERIQPAIAQEPIAELFFSPRECAALRSLPVHARLEAFFTCWTRKEAYVKARGEGLVLSLDRFDVSLTPGEPPALLRTIDADDAARWTLHALDPGPGYIGALAVAKPTARLRYWQWIT